MALRVVAEADESSAAQAAAAARTGTLELVTALEAEGTFGVGIVVALGAAAREMGY